MNNMTLGEAYEVLELPIDANFDNVKKRYHVLAKKYHPDSDPNDQSLCRKFQEIKIAYDVIEKHFKELYLMSEHFFDDINAEFNEDLKDYFYKQYENRRRREEEAYKKSKFLDPKFLRRKIIGDSSVFMTTEEVTEITNCLKEFNSDFIKSEYFEKTGNYDIDDTETLFIMFEEYLKGVDLPEEFKEELVFVMSECSHYYDVLYSESYKLSGMFVRSGRYDVDEIMGTAFIFPEKKEELYCNMLGITPDFFTEDLADEYKNVVFSSFLNILSLGKLKAEVRDGDVCVDYLCVLNMSKEKFYEESPSGTEEELEKYLQGEFVSKEK